MATHIPPLSHAVIRRLSEFIGDTGSGLIGREIHRLLLQARIEDPGEMTKRERLDLALTGAQRRDGAANAVLRFIEIVMEPVRFADEENFEDWRSELNEILAYERLTITKEGRVSHRDKRATTISEARERANRFKEKLGQRGIHPEILRACADEIDDENYFHTVFEATKSLAERVRQMSGITGDGIPLINEVFGRKSGLPRIAFNGLQDCTDESEHDGNVNIMRGIFGAFRNPTGHRPKVTWPIPEADALDMMSTMSLLHRRLDSAVEVPEHVRQSAASQAA